MKKICIYLLLLFSKPLFGQVNLVPNPSFEDTVSCPITNGVLVKTAYWLSPTNGHGLYFNSCANIASTNSPYGVPQNSYSYQNAFEGNAYILLGLIGLGGTGNGRYYAEVKLADTLNAGKNYLVSLRLSLADSSNYACDDIGVYFSDLFVHNDTIQTNLTFNPQIQNPVGNLLNNKNGWTLVSGIYTAIGNESWITIGNFKPDSLSNYYSVSGGAPWSTGSEVLIDSVVIAEIVGTGMELIGTENSFQVYPNPVNDFIKIIISTTIKTPVTIQLYNNYNQLKLEKENLRESYVELNIADLPKGIYYLLLKNKKINIVKKIIKL